MRPYNVEIFTQDFEMVGNTNVNEITYKEDYLSSDGNTVTVLALPGVKKQDYIRISRGDEEYAGIVTEIGYGTDKSKKLQTISYKPLMELLNTDVRPLLDVTRKDVLDYLADKGLTYVTDSSNLLNDVKRNRLRNVILPAVRAYFPDAQTTLTRSIHNLTGNLALYTELIAHCSEGYRNKHGDIDISRLCREMTNAGMMLYEMLRGYGFNAVQCGDMISCIEESESRRFYSRGYVGVLYKGMLTVRARNQDVALSEESYIISPDDMATCPEGFSIERIPVDYVSYDRTGNTLFLDTDKVGGRKIVVRRWRLADRIAPYGMNGTKLVSDLFSDAHYSPSDKENAWIVTVGGQIVWAVGLRTSRHMTIGKSTVEAIKITFTPADARGEG